MPFWGVLVEKSTELTIMHMLLRDTHKVLILSANPKVLILSGTNRHF